MVPMGMWTYAELSTGIVISCLPVIPKFFQHVGPRLSSALNFGSKSTKCSGGDGAASAAKHSENVPAAEKLRLPSFKHTFASVVASDAAENHDDCELDDEESRSQKMYFKLREDSEQGRDGTGELGGMTQAKYATVRDDLERGYGKF